MLAAAFTREARSIVVYAVMLTRLPWLLHQAGGYAFVGSHRGHQADDGKRLPKQA